MFEDRADAAFKLCPKLRQLSGRNDVIVVGLMRGGIVTASVLAKVLKLKLTALIVKKIPDPQNPELAIGAMISLKDIYLNESLIQELKVPDIKVNQLILKKWEEIQLALKTLNIKYNYHYRDKTILVVDDGVATGASAIAAADFFKKRKAAHIILITPVISTDTYKVVKKYFDRIIFLLKEENFYAVGQFYRNFSQVTNEEAVKLLKRYW